MEGSRPNSLKKDRSGPSCLGEHIPFGPADEDPRGPRTCQPRINRRRPSEPETPVDVETDPRFPVRTLDGDFS